jgi:hypothetical protein
VAYLRTYSTFQRFTYNLLDVRSRETDTLLLLYEFEARIHLKDPAVEKVLERALTMAGPDPKSFEALAGNLSKTVLAMFCIDAYT